MRLVSGVSIIIIISIIKSKTKIVLMRKKGMGV